MSQMQAPASPFIEVDTGMVYSGRESGKKTVAWAQPSVYTPKQDPNFFFPQWSADILVWLFQGREPLYLFGPTGCGKTSCLKQLVAKLNYPVYEVTGHNRLEFPELAGHLTVVPSPNGQSTVMQYEYGPLALAMKYGGLFLLNEADLLDPATAAGLNTVLDGSPLVIVENAREVIQPHPLFKFAATANTNGGGDTTGMYQGTLRANLAMMDRYVLVEADYLDERTEQNILRRVAASLPEDLTNKMVAFAGMVRKLFMGGDVEHTTGTLSVTCSTRTLLRWAYLIQCYEPLRSKGVDIVGYSLERALSFKASKAEQLTIKELYQRLFN